MVGRRVNEGENNERQDDFFCVDGLGLHDVRDGQTRRAANLVMGADGNYLQRDLGHGAMTTPLEWAGAAPFVTMAQNAAGIDGMPWGDEFLAWYKPGQSLVHW